jgi:tetratricopeptide (TPR) repeat protein
LSDARSRTCGAARRRPSTVHRDTDALAVARRPAASVALVLLVTALLAPLAPRTVRGDDGVRRPHASAPFWARVREPGAARARGLLASARGWLDLATETPGGWATLCAALDGDAAQSIRERLVKQSVAAENAIARLTRARAASPDDPDILFALALATTLWERPARGCAVQRRDAEARTLWQALRTLDPGYEPEAVGAELALAHTRLGALDAAIATYAELVPQTDHAPRRALLAHGNLAELLMIRGDVRDAVGHYERAIDLARALDDPDALALAELGLACALVRLGEHAEALVAARAAVDRSGDSLRVLRSAGVFFVPAWEVHVYEALGQEARADGNRAPLPAPPARASRSESLAQALDALLARTLSRAALDDAARDTAAWLDAASREPSPGAADAERLREQALAATIVRLGDAHEANKRRERETAGGDALRTISDALPAAAPDTAETRLRRTLGCLVAAARSWRRYLDEGGSAGQSSTLARAQLARLGARIAALAPVPARRVHTRARTADGRSR